MDNLRLYISTYNVGTSNPDQELKELFAISDQKNEKGPDFFILGFQEVKAQPHNMVMDTLFDDPWTMAVKELLQRDYIKLKSVRLQGLLLIVFSLRKHLLNIREMESEYTRTGLAGMWEQLCKSSLRQAAGPRLIQTDNQLQTGFGIIGPHQCSLGFHGCMHAGSYCPSSFAEMNTAIDHRIHLGDRLESTPEGHFEYEMEQLCKSSLRQAAGPRLIQTDNQLQTGFGIIGPHQCSLGFHGCMHAGSYCPSSFAEMNTAIDHRIHLGDRLESTPEGHFEYEMGNKGAVTIRLSIYGCSICFVNAHLSAHDNQLKDRVEDYNSIIQEQEFHVPETSKIFYHDYVFWMGDLNFRLQEEFDKTPEEIERLIIKKELKPLFEHDQLRTVMKKGEAFSEFTEQDPDFPPTFKFEVGAPCYDHKRRPAWCDRILYCVNRDNYENVTLKVEQLSYKSHPSYTLSDHKPVTAEFIIKIPQQVQKITKKSLLMSVDQVFSDYSESVVEFDKIINWQADDENTVFYTVTKSILETTDDWIGLFKDNFNALDDYVTYEYVNKCTSPVDPSDKTTKAEGDPPARPTRFKVTFPEVPNHCRGIFCLVYFSQTDDKVASVLGISNPFIIN